jgi:hypothetical protein
VPVQRMHRARDLSRLHEIAEQVEHDLDSPDLDGRDLNNVAPSPDDASSPSQHAEADADVRRAG